MSVYDAQIGHRCKVYSGDLEIDNVICCDTRTGDMLVYLKDENDKFIRTKYGTLATAVINMKDVWVKPIEDRG